MLKPFGPLKENRDWVRDPAIRKMLVFWLGFFGVGLTIALLLGMRAWTLPTIAIQIASGVASLLVLLGAEWIIRRTRRSCDLDAHARA